ncbi:hypothetical protein FZEAL_10182 [Fusarium zealandicum]|uniref:Translation initiation factor 3 C-terminal domain-containing protein n=1 Tax=Fusarium zealandicum TaxID=1053134 RepID=A0A8H4XC49_9HYPO|nr:hypothetical protein FZEAL_10182 [Fusarium zealandicum]
MSSFSCLQSSRRALYRVFVSPLDRHEAILARQLLSAARAVLPSVHQNRLFTASSQFSAVRAPPKPQSAVDDDDDRGFDRRFTTRDDFAKSGRDRLPQDHEIKDPKIMVIDNGIFDGPLLTRHVMSRLNEGESLRMVTPYMPANTKDNKPMQFAVCKVVNKKEEYERQREVRARQRVSKQTSTKTKELELSWAIGENDLQTKVRQLSGFLAKGMKVEVILGYKKRTKKRVDEAAAADVLAKVRKGVEEVGAREYKPEDGQVGKTLRLFLEGTAKPQKPSETSKSATTEAPVQSE